MSIQHPDGLRVTDTVSVDGWKGVAFEIVEFPEGINDIAICEMVGDSSISHRFSVGDLTKLKTDEYCHECGQIYCKH